MPLLLSYSKWASLLLPSWAPLLVVNPRSQRATFDSGHRGHQVSKHIGLRMVKVNFEEYIDSCKMDHVLNVLS